MWTRMVGGNLSGPSAKEGSHPSSETKHTVSEGEEKKPPIAKPKRLYAFVNKDSTTIGTRSKEEAVMVHSHVARNAYHSAKKRRAKMKQPDAKHRKETPWEKNPDRYPIDEARHRRSRLEDSPDGYIGLNKEINKRPVLQKSVSDDKSSDPANDLLLLQGAAVRRWVQIKPAPPPPLPSPSRTLGQGASDPFNAAALPLDATRHALLQLSRTLWTGFLFPIDRENPNAQQQSTDAWNRKTYQTVSDRFAFHSDLSVVLAFVTRYMGHVKFGHKTSTLFNIHSTLSLNLLRKHLASGNLDHKTLLHLWEACLCAFFQGDFQAMKMHFEAMRIAAQLLKRMGAPDNPLLKDILIVGKLLLGTWLLEPENDPDCIVTAKMQLEADPPLPKPDEVAVDTTQAKTSSMPTLEEPPLTLHNPWLDDSLLNHLRRNKAAITTVQRLDDLYNSPDHRSTYASLKTWLHDRLMALTSYTLTLHHAILHTTTDALTKQIRSTFCLATCYARRLVLDCTWLTARVFVPFFHLRSHLENLLALMTEDPGYLIYADCVLWMFFVGACAEEVIFKSRILNNDDFSRSRWFSVRFLKVCETMGYAVGREEDRERMATGFEKYVFDAQMRVLLEEVCKKRALLERRVREVEMPPLLLAGRTED